MCVSKDWQYSAHRKIVIGLLLCSGLFVITAAIIRVALTLGAHPSALNVNRWGVRETIVGIITVNIPILRPMMSRNFWKTGQVSYPTGRGTETGGRSTTLGSGQGPYEMAGSGGGKSRVNDSFGSSEECIVDIKGNTNLRPGDHNVVVHTMYHVTSEDIQIDQATNEWEPNGAHTKTFAYWDSNAVWHP